ncbi:unnamed protein product [Oikopleura dioica]|uniref:Uncharacterized protein n=1 Tax=Oikopleura dioica TaxID=34765 RepID=E4X221_OIKDI|nr:unnamed protein product [Oikopleura dioica]CBY43546.1 unnamed protein product [Oikopleura dioica]
MAFAFALEERIQRTRSNSISFKQRKLLQNIHN